MENANAIRGRIGASASGVGNYYVRMSLFVVVLYVVGASHFMHPSHASVPTWVG